MIYSMTGFSTRSFSFLGQNYKIEIKSLNHRFLELKLRTPREWNSFESGLRALVEAKVKRGSVDLWIERVQDPTIGINTETKINFAQAEAAYEVFSQLQTRFKLADGITLRDLISFPEVLQKSSTQGMTESGLKVLQKTIDHEVALALDDLLKMRGQEGLKLQIALMLIVDQFKKAHDRLLTQRSLIQKKAQEKVKKRIEQCFEAYATPDAQMRALMESRIAQEISYALEKLDIEEELTRFKGHVDQIESVLKLGGVVGKKIDFLFQELNREVNTLGNKSQDLEVSQDVIQLKMGIEQMREQSLNLE